MRKVLSFSVGLVFLFLLAMVINAGGSKYKELDRVSLRKGIEENRVLAEVGRADEQRLKAARVKVGSGYGKMPLLFIPNKGQFDERVFFAVNGRDKSIYFTAEGLTYVLMEQKKEERQDLVRSLRDIGQVREDQVAARKRWAVKLDFVNVNKGVKPESLKESETVISYFKGKRDDWKAGMRASSRIIYRNLWDGIDLVYYGTVNRMKYEFIVHPGADPEQVRLVYRGVDDIKVDGDGRLVVETPLGGFVDDVPVAWQGDGDNRKEVKISYELKKGDSGAGRSEYGFAVGKYDRDLPLVLDPAVLVYCGFIGGSDEDYGYGIAVDVSGNAYVTGYTSSNDSSFPVAVGPDLTFNGDRDAFVAKINASGTALVYCGYIGGSEWDTGSCIAVDASGNAYVTGETHSYFSNSTFPVTVGPDLTFNGKFDAFVAKVNAAGTALVYCGYIGGSKDDSGIGIAVDSSGNAYVTGATYSDELTFPVAVGPDLTFNGGRDAFVAKINASGSALVYCGFIGGSNGDSGYGIVVDVSGNAYVTGATYSDELTFPVAVGPDLTFNGDRDAFVAKINASGSALVYCGFIGGSNGDSGYGIVVDVSGNAYITGYTESNQSTFPVAVGPDLTFNGDCDAFVAKINTSGTALVYCGYIGGLDCEYCNAIAVDSFGNAYVIGRTFSDESTFPVVNGPDLTFNGGSCDAFVAKVNTSGSTLVYCGYIGGNFPDWGQCIALDTSGNAYVIGFTGSSETTFPLTVGPDLTYNGGYYDAFVAKISEEGSSYTISAEVWGGGGRAEPAVQTVNAGDNAVVRFEADPGYRLTELTDNGHRVNPVNEYRLYNVDSDHQLVGVFSNEPPWVAITRPIAGAVVSGTVQVLASIDDDSGVDVVEFSVDGQLIESRAVGGRAASVGVIGRPAAVEYSFTWDSSVYAVGNHTLRVLARDRAGAVGMDEKVVQLVKISVVLTARRESVRAWSFTRDYGVVSLVVDNQGVTVGSGKLMRRSGNGSWQLLKEISASEIQGGSWSYQDKYLEKGLAYCYLVEIYDPAGILLVRSNEASL